MRNGILWFDNSPDTTLEEKIQKAVEYYTKKHGTTPNLCLIHPSMLNNGTKIVDLTIRPYLPVLPGHFWICVEDNTPMQTLWHSYTGRFGSEEVASIQDTWKNKFDELVDMLLVSDPIVALRAITEIMFNSGYVYPEPKFGELLQNKKLSEHWANFLTDPQVDSYDRGYAVSILNEMLKISPELMKAQADILSQKLK